MGNTMRKLQPSSPDVDNACRPFSNCPISNAIALIGGKWKLPVLYNLRDHVMRFNELKRALPGVTQKMLTQQLREMENDGLIERKVYAEVPPKVEYSLTPIARKLQPILTQLCGWGWEHRTLQEAETPSKK
ncbi:MAG: helix-turn-helix domain-containing protein [Alphaproteobacteria bacterium]